MPPESPPSNPTKDTQTTCPSSIPRRQVESDPIVISGISGRYPESMNMEEFWNKLISGKELSSIDDRRWPVGELFCFIIVSCVHFGNNRTSQAKKRKLI